MIDLRSDTVTLPSPEMREAMAAAPVGDDVYGEDPTIIALQHKAAAMLGKEAALFAPSGTQSNLLALLSHCERGDEYIVGQHAHTYEYEAGGAAVLGSIQPQPLDFEPDGTLDLDKVARAVKPDDYHFARSRLLCLENTMGGKVLPMDYLAEAEKTARRLGLALHLDGARLFNATVRLGVAAADIARHFDSVSICLSKGLGAPVGSLLVADAALIARARRWRKMLGGGMRQAGILAAAGIYALEHNIERLAEDHANARRLAEGLARIDGLHCDPNVVHTNMVFVTLDTADPADFVAHMARHGVKLSPGKPMRLVTHLDISSDDIDRIVSAASSFASTSVSHA